LSIRVPEPIEALTFADESTTRTKHTKKVSVHGQVVRGTNLDWLGDIKEYFPPINGEVKSNRVIDAISRISRETRKTIEAGLRHVRVHIVDPLSYEAQHKEWLRKTHGCDGAFEKLKQEAKEGDLLAKVSLKIYEGSVAKDILDGMPSKRLQNCLRYASRNRFLYIPDELLSPQSTCEDWQSALVPHRKDGKSIISVTTSYASQECVVYSDALDFANRCARTWGEHESRRVVSGMISTSHGFDEGDEASVNLLSESRHYFLEHGYEYFDEYSAYAEQPELGRLYPSVASELSPHVQCADLAAGFAKDKYAKHGLCSVVEMFDYVTLNGKRIDEGNFDSTVSYWKGITDREDRIQSLISN
jgi:hypothetical protein